MAVVPGITNIATDAPDTGGQLGSRAPTPDNLPAPPQLQPQAQPTNTYKGYAQFSDPNMQRLADSLGQLAPQIFQFGNLQNMHDRPIMQDQAAARLAGLTPDQQQQVLNSDPLFKNYMAAQHGQSLYGLNYGEQGQYGATAFNQFINTQFDRTNGDFNQFSNDWVKSGLAQVGNNPVAQAAYLRRMQPEIDAARQQQTQFNTQTQVNNQFTLEKGGISGLIGQAITTNTDPAQALQAARTQMATSSIFAKLTPDQQNQALVAALSDRLESMKDDPRYPQTWKLVSGMLNAPYTNAQGVTTNLLQDQAVAGKARDVMANANTIYWQRDEADNNQAIANVHHLAETGDPGFQDGLKNLLQQYPRYEHARQATTLQDLYQQSLDKKSALLQQQQAQQASDQYKSNLVNTYGMPAVTSGNAHAIQDQPVPTYDAKTGQTSWNMMPAQEIRQQSVERQDDNLQRTIKDPQQLLASQIQLYGNAGVINKQWKDTLSIGAGAATTANAANGNFPQATTDGLSLYRNLQAANPALLAMHTDKQSQDFYNIASSAIDGLHYTPAQALTMAQRSTSDPDFGKALPDTDKRQEIQTVKSQLSNGIYGAVFGDLSNSKNSDEVAAKVVEAADVVRRATGIPMENAIKQVAPTVGSNYTVVNGYAVNVNGKEIPPNFSPLANKYIQDFTSQNQDALGKLGITPDQLTIENVGKGGNWSLWANGRPLPSTIPGSAFGTAQLFQEQAALKKPNDATAAATKIDHSNDPWLVLGDPRTPYSMTVGPFYGLSGQTPAKEQATKAGAIQMYEDQKKTFNKLQAAPPAPDPLAGITMTPP